MQGRHGRHPIAAPAYDATSRQEGHPACATSRPPDRSAAGGGATRTFTVGFCFGGRNSFNQAATAHGLDGVIGFYGWPQRTDPDDRSAPTVCAADYRCRELGLFGGSDQAIPPEAVDAFRSAIEAAGVANEIVVYPGAPHSFFDRRAEEHADASVDAWRRMLGFVGAAA